MKVKEALSNEFKEDKKIWEGREQIVLKEKGNLVLFEPKTVREHLPYSRYLIYDMGGNLTYMKIDVPDPEKKDLYKDIFLKYQHGARKFMSKFFDVLVGDKEDIEIAYNTKQKEEFEYEQYDDWSGTVWIKLIGDGFVFAEVGFTDKDINLRVAEKFIKYFSGVKVSFSDEVGLCEQ